MSLPFSEKDLAVILQAVGAESIHSFESVQSLWSGYGEIVRLNLNGPCASSVVVKWIDEPSEQNHPRGWNTNLSHQRKLHSYQVEMAWYQQWAAACNGYCRIPNCLFTGRQGSGRVIVMEDLDAAGFSERRDSVSRQDVEQCLLWLASFHAGSLEHEPKDLWPTGTYWHLATRPDEYEAMQDIELQQAAKAIDTVLASCRFKSLVHGDAKLANFCFSPVGDVAAVDFQYVGGGCGMKDVAYFLGSCLAEQQCFEQQDELLDFYFSELTTKVMATNSAIDVEALETEWRAMYALAWTDFSRFLNGWMPGHWKLNGYSKYLAGLALTQLRIRGEN
ncbi:MAG: hypothetical protein ACI92E_003089 [Oceanicoccus sp.]